jgi:replicative DNA helicase
MSTPNHSFELEQRVLELLMGFSEATNANVQKSMLELTTDCFYNPDNAVLFTMIRKCFEKKEPFGFIDILVLIPKEQESVHSALSWIIENNGKFHSSESHFLDDVSKIILLSKIRKQIKLAEGLTHNIKNYPKPEEARDLINATINDMSVLNFQTSKAGVTNIDLADNYLEGKLPKNVIIPTTCEQLNSALMGGIRAKSFITIAAGAGVGKTGFAIYLLDCIARNQPLSQNLFFSIEMEARHIWERHVGICAGQKFDSLTEHKISVGIDKSCQVPITIYDAQICPTVSDIDFIVTTARLKAMEQPISVIVVDYLGLVRNNGNFERNDLRQADITSKLAELAIQLDCTVIALSQINRGASTRASDDRCPYPHDAADSSGSHRSSTLWLGVDRPELYNDDPAYKNQFVVKCRKNRFGGIFELILGFNDGTFAEMPAAWFKKPMSRGKHAEKATFSPFCDDFYPNG